MAILPHHLSEVIMGVLLVVVLWFVIAKFVAPKFEEAYQLRRDAIEGGIERAEEAQRKAEAALQQYEEQLSGARAEAARIREDAKNEGATILSEMREQAQAESERIISQARTQLEAERTKVVTELRSEVGGLATSLAGRIVGESLDDDERARRTVDRFIADLESSSTTEGAVAGQS
ncbi:F0F1 ATP synthase subunit B [Propionibacteriaceae bacterium Y2011]|uniref:F0F1 ATP synthase subunit B n=1 Tax=Microlunatus sp. Y2014 TaxID=3418488 RepID=UPI003B4B7997